MEVNEPETGITIKKQILKINLIKGNILYLNKPTNLDFSVYHNAEITKVIMSNGSGIDSETQMNDDMPNAGAVYLFR